MRCYGPIWRLNLKRSKRIMAQTPDEIAKEIVVAWLSHNPLAADINDTTKTGERIGKIYTAVLQAVGQGIESRPPPDPLSPPSVEGELGETAS
jgi:hypothetical protein